MPAAMEVLNSHREIGVQTNIVLGTLNVKFVIQDSEEDMVFSRQFSGVKTNTVFNGSSCRSEEADSNGQATSSPLTPVTSHQRAALQQNFPRLSENPGLPLYPPLSVIPSYGQSAFPTLPTSVLPAGVVTSSPLPQPRQPPSQPATRSEQILRSIQRSVGRETLPLASKQILRKPRKVVNPRPRNLLSRPWLANAVRAAAVASVQNGHTGDSQSSAAVPVSQPTVSSSNSNTSNPVRCSSVEVGEITESGRELKENDSSSKLKISMTVQGHDNEETEKRESNTRSVCHRLDDTKNDIDVSTKDSNIVHKSHESMNRNSLHSPSSEGDSDTASVTVKEEPHEEDFESCHVTNSSDSEGQNLDTHDFSPVGGDTSVDSSMMSPNGNQVHDHREISPTTKVTSSNPTPTIDSAVNSLAALSGMNSEHFFENFIGRNLHGAALQQDPVQRRHSFENGSSVFPPHGAFPHQDVRNSEDLNSSAPVSSFFTSYQPKGTFLNKEERDQRKERYKEFYRELTIIDNESGRRKPKFECRLCNAVSSRKDRMIDHIEFKHFNIRSYPCDGCNVKFSTYSNLAQHRKKQHGLDGVDIPRGQAAYNEQGLRVDKARHVRHLFFKIQDYNNTGFMNRSYQCKLCSYRSTRTDRMVIHIEAHHREYMCSKD
ncbi:endochitinase A [Lingula anatina]|uniref:Endochitinase A n=1 Tax=Lingula anatina TaxID=7574 RepID=A0A1S3HJQ3_LINAN|nr:endochitinase A [Lingula anatina]XP_013386347.1 endochitinase A [Lingula anatina]XP_013386348.1 endochitinase A [Lingula anatina]XP_013386349.1 endochitinase A [Lingula anatina]|eukprot:XP_013386346.1 endochitinase A [Lingula anatina]